jgi:hypothetical protein
MLCRAALVRTNVSKKLSASFIRVTRIGEFGTTLVVFLRSVLQLLVTANVPSSLILVTLMMEAICSSLTSVLTRATRRTIPEGAILYYKAPIKIDMVVSIISGTDADLFTVVVVARSNGR